MTRFTATSSDDRLQYMTFAALSIAVVGATAVLYLFQVPYFRLYFGSINSLLAVALVAVLGSVSLYFLHSCGWFWIWTKEAFNGAVRSAAFAAMFAAAAILVDVTVGFPRDLNVPAPWSLLFYPIMAYVVEICFHVAPLALLLVILGRLFRTLDSNHLVWICIFIAASLEPVFQLRLGFSRKLLSGLAVFVGVHIFAFNLFELYVFRRYGFVSMYSFRLAYYIGWHIVWGSLRLQLLF